MTCLAHTPSYSTILSQMLYKRYCTTVTHFVYTYYRNENIPLLSLKILIIK